MTEKAASVEAHIEARLVARARSVLAVREVGVLVAFVLLCAALTLATPYFLAVSNLLAVGRQISLLGIICMGMTLVLIAGEFDLSVGSVYGLAGVASALVLKQTHSALFAVGTGLLIGAAFGLFNGLVTTYGRIPAFITTLGSLNMARGLALVITQAFPIVIEGVGVPQSAVDAYLTLGRPQLFDIVPIQLVYFLAAIGVSAFVLHYTVLGYHIYAVGGSSIAARSSGINPHRVKIVTFFVTGILSAFAGMSSVAFIGNALPMGGQGIEFDAFSGVIIGGTAIGGGVGTIWGTVIGVALIGVLRNGLVLLGVGPFWQMVAIGVVVIVAVTVDRWLMRRT